MLVLDTNHVREFAAGSVAGARLRDRIGLGSEETATTIVCAEETLRGWLAELHRLSNPHEQIAAYRKLHDRIEFFAAWLVLPWDSDAADRFIRLRRDRVRIGTMDLKIACITLAHDATLLTRPFDCAQGTRNTGDFAKVPGLKFENWLD